MIDIRSGCAYDFCNELGEDKGTPGRGQARTGVMNHAPTMDELRQGSEPSTNWVRTSQRTGRGQAIAPTMDELRQGSEPSIVGAMACPRPVTLQKSYRPLQLLLKSA